MSYLQSIAKVRTEILRDNEEPRDLMISEALKHAVLLEVNPLRLHATATYDHLMGMKIEWTKAKPLTQPQISIRTAKGDVRIVPYRGADAASPPHDSTKEK